MSYYRFEFGGLPKARIAAACTLRAANYGDADRCVQCDRVVSMLRWLPPFQVELELLDSKPWPSVIPAGAKELLVSTDFVRVWTAAGLRGLEGFEAIAVTRVVRRVRECTALPNYLHARVCPSTAYIDDVASGVVRRSVSGRPCDWCGGGSPRWYDRLVVREDPACQLDLFTARNATALLASERFVKALADGGITDLVLTPADEAWWDERAPGVFGRGLRPRADGTG